MIHYIQIMKDSTKTQPAAIAMTPKFLAIIKGAGRAFGQYGFARTQMADIAVEADVALGTLYRYTPSKDVLFYLVLLHGAGASDAEVAAAASCADVSAILESFVMGLGTAANIQEALERARRSDTPIIDFIGDMYDAVDSIHVALRVLDRSGREWPDVADLFNRELRAPVLQITEQFLSEPALTHAVRRVPDVVATGRLILETIAWMAMHRRFSAGTENISDSNARIAVLDFANAALDVRTK